MLQRVINALAKDTLSLLSTEQKWRSATLTQEKYNILSFIYKKARII